MRNVHDLCRQQFICSAERHTVEAILEDYDEIGGGIAALWKDRRTMEGHFDVETCLDRNFARSDRTALTGVADDDRNGIGFFDMGEGLAGVVFDRIADTKTGATSWAAGGYGLGLGSKLGALEEFAVTAAGATMKVKVRLAGENVKLDNLGGATFAASADLALGKGAEAGVLLGVADLGPGGINAANRFEGNAGDNEIPGNKGADRLRGGAGDDALWGKGGKDVLLSTDPKKGHFGRDIIGDFEKGDTLRIDPWGELPTEAKWEDGHIDRTGNGFKVAPGDGGVILVETDLSRSAFEDALTLVRHRPSPQAEAGRRNKRRRPSRQGEPRDCILFTPGGFA